MTKYDLIKGGKFGSPVSGDTSKRLAKGGGSTIRVRVAAPQSSDPNTVVLLKDGKLFLPNRNSLFGRMVILEHATERGAIKAGRSVAKHQIKAPKSRAERRSEQSNSMLLLSLRDLADRIGASPGQKLSADNVERALSAIAGTASDLFDSESSALTFIDRDNFGDTGMSARELIAEGRATSILARLDELRFGVQG